MRVTRLYLRNYRVYEEPLDLELPPGLVGIYGLNGAGKSNLIESIRWTLYGRTRTSIEEVRTSGVNADCLTEVEFEHEGHLYLVRRGIVGAGATVRATAFADGQQVAEGVRDTGRYVHSILGMDDASFRASVFAEQKQLASFSTQTPAERRRLVLQLLGITPLDAARDAARRDARDRAQQHERLRGMLADLDVAKAALAEAEAARVLADRAAAADEADTVDAARSLESTARRVEELDQLRQRHERLAAELQSGTAEHQRAAESAARLAAEMAELDDLGVRLAALREEAEGWKEAEARLRLVEAVVASQSNLERLPPARAIEPPDEEGWEAARSAAEASRAALAAVAARYEGAQAERDRAAAAFERSSELTGEASCPVCGQELGASFAAVQAHRAAELTEVDGRLLELGLDRRRATAAANATAERALAMSRSFRAAQEVWTEHEKLEVRRAEAQRALAEAVAALGRPLQDSERVALVVEVERRRRAADECPRLQGRLERRAAATAELDVERAALADAEATLTRVRAAVAEIGLCPEELTAARLAHDEARARSEAAVARARASQVAAGQAVTRVEAAGQRLADATEQHAGLEALADDTRHRGRVADLLGSFRNTLVASVGPRLSTQAAELFSELTDAEYDQLEVDPDTYEIKIRDEGRLYGMDRFSGSETDLANLALRVAVSEHIRFQAGGAVGLLVLDEVFGPLDDDRKERMLLALERLRSRFRQVLVVTHDAAIKEQLPNAIEVVKRPGRRATARVING